MNEREGEGCSFGLASAKEELDGALGKHKSLVSISNDQKAGVRDLWKNWEDEKLTWVVMLRKIMRQKQDVEWLESEGKLF